jgi:signal transduction histidine kinase
MANDRTNARPSHPAQSTRGRAADDCLAGGGEMGTHMRALNWSTTPLGPVEGWPQSLKTAVSIMLASRFAMVVAWGPEFRLFYNDRYRPVLGASKHPSALGAPAKLVFPEAWPFIGPLFESTLQGEAVALDDVLIPLNRYGYLENCYFTLSYSPISDETGQVAGMLAVVAETTERVEGERRLKMLRDLARRAADSKTAEDACANAASILANNPIDVPFALLYLCSQDGTRAHLIAATGLARDTNASPTMVDLTRLDPGDGWPLGEVTHSQELCTLDDLPVRFGPLPGGPYPEPTHTAILVSLMRPGQPHPDGLLVFGVSPRRALDDAYRGFYELAADHIFTAIRNARAHEEERQRAEALAELDRAKTAFFSNVSHEFRTPLTLMLGPLEDALADAHDPPSPRHRERLELMHRNSLRLLKLVNTLLDFSRIEAGRIQAVYEPTDLAAYTTELASVFRSAIERAALHLSVDCPPLLELVYVDREMWEKIVLNLLSNAFKFTFAGEIAVALRWAGGAAELSVRDTGMGIPEDELPHIFERFHRVRSTQARTYEGTGIGLTLVQELVKLHGGAVTVTSAVERGSTFTVTIPAGSAHLPSERLGAPRMRPSTAVAGEVYVEEALHWSPEHTERAVSQGVWADGAWSPPHVSVPPDPSKTPFARILLADDNADMREYVRRLLRERWDVEAVHDGAAALAAARARVPDLVLTDVMMPGLDGFELLRELRAEARTREVPVILLSARAGEESRVEGLEAGADDYLIKPFSARELMARVGAHLKLSRVRREAAEALAAANAEAERRARAAEEAQALLQASLHEKEVLLKEIHHRVKNNLQVIASLLYLQSDQLKDPEDVALFEDTQHRVKSMALIHESLYSTGNLAHFNFARYIESLSTHLFASYATGATHIRLHTSLEELAFDVDTTVPCGLLLNELLTNALKYAFPNGRPGEIYVTLRTEAGHVSLSVCDTGIGIPEELDFRHTESLGLQLVCMLTEQLGGTMTLTRERGTTFTVRFPYPTR